MHHPQINKSRLFIVIVLVTITIVIASLTVGLDIYYGTRGQGLLSFAIVSFTGFLFFFLFVPVELAFIFYLTSGVNLWLLNLVALGTALIAELIDYYIGYSLSKKIIDQLIGRHRYEKAEDEIKKYGNITIFISNFLPLSSPIISLAAGMLKIHIKDFLIFSILGLLLRYLVLSLIFYK